MKNKKFIIPILLILISCNPKPIKLETESKKKYSNITNDKDTLICISNDGSFEAGSSCGYINKRKDTVIPIGTFDMCFTDSFATFAYVIDKELFGDAMVAINRKKEVIFDAYLFDNGPDYIEEGLFRIKRNEKIGFANSKGEVVIEPQFECAYPFESGKAKVALDCETIKEGEYSRSKSSNWFYIDKKGNKIK